jgi:hypothetical protein
LSRQAIAHIPSETSDIEVQSRQKDQERQPIVAVVFLRLKRVNPGLLQKTACQNTGIVGKISAFIVGTTIILQF